MISLFDYIERLYKHEDAGIFGWKENAGCVWATALRPDPP